VNDYAQWRVGRLGISLATLSASQRLTGTPKARSMTFKDEGSPCAANSIDEFLHQFPTVKREAAMAVLDAAYETVAADANTG